MNPPALRVPALARVISMKEALGALGTLALLLICRPYRGVRHDTVLYVGQILHRLMPERFENDPFFSHGSQDRWSLFSPAMAPLVGYFGLSDTLVVVLWICQLAFLGACWLLVKDWPSRAWRWAAVLAVVVLPHTYGGLGKFSYSEPFLTARSIAEPLALLALGQLMRGRHVLAVVLASCALAFHPLMAAPIVLVGWVWLILDKREWGWLALLGLLPVAAGMAGVAPFDALFHRFDVTWFASVGSFNATAFASSYGMLDWMPVVFDAWVLWLFMRRAPGREMARLAKATLISGVGVGAIWVVGADLMHDVLLTQLQLWRILWPLHLLAVLAMPLIVRDFWLRGWVGRWVATALCLAGLATMSNWPTGWVCLLWFGAALLALQREVSVARSTALLAVLGSAAAMVAVTVKVARITMGAVAASPDRFAGEFIALVLLNLPLVSAAIATGVVFGMQRKSSRMVPVMGGVLALLVGYGLAAWDQRSAWQRYLEDAVGHDTPVFDTVIPPRASVYWQPQLVEAWLLGRRGDYYSEDQGAGLLFDRDNALDFERRRKALVSIDLQHQVCEEIDLLTRKAGAPAATCNVSAEVFAETCHNAEHPDYFVFTAPMEAPPLAQWHAPAGISAEARSYYLYRCPGIR